MTVSFNLKYKKQNINASSVIRNPSFPLDCSIDTELLVANIPNSGHLYGESRRLSYRITPLCQIRGINVIGFRSHVFGFCQIPFVSIDVAICYLVHHVESKT